MCPDEYLEDCNGDCFGNAMFDDCGVCWKPYCYNEETENKSNDIDDKALFLSEASKYGKLISLKEIENES